MNAEQANWIDLRRMAPGGVAVVPLGSFEQHGPHLPMGTDAMLVEAMVGRAAEAAGMGGAGRVAVFPTVRYSFVEWARPLASAGVSMHTLIAGLVEVCRDIRRIGFRRIVTVNGHAGLAAARTAFWQLRHEGAYGLFVDLHPYEMAAEAAAKVAGEPLTHAGVIETSMMLAACPGRVDMARAVDGPTDLWGEDFPYPTLRKQGVYCVPTISALPDGVEGRPTRATAELGGRLLDLYAAAIADVLADLLATDVPAEFLNPPDALASHDPS